MVTPANAVVIDTTTNAGWTVSGPLNNNTATTATNTSLPGFTATLTSAGGFMSSDGVDMAACQAASEGRPARSTGLVSARDKSR